MTSKEEKKRKKQEKFYKDVEKASRKNIENRAKRDGSKIEWEDKKKRKVEV